jgi:hypothetical protein
MDEWFTTGEFNSEKIGFFCFGDDLLEENKGEGFL